MKDDKGEYPLGTHMEILEDPGGKLTIGDVSSPKFNSRFTPSQKETQNYGLTDSAYWVRFTLQGESRLTDHWFLVLGHPLIHYVDLYLPGGNGYLVRQTGLLRPFSTRDIANNKIVFHLPLQPNERKTFYMRFQTGDSMTLPLVLWNPESFFERSGFELLLLGIFYGIFLIMLLYNLFLFFSLREASYFYFVCFLASGILLFASYDAVGAQYLWPNHPAWNRYAVPLFFILFMASITLFSNAFLETRRRTPTFHRVFISVIAGWGILLLLVPIVSYRLIAFLMAIWGIITFGVTFAGGAVAWKQGYQPARYFLLSWLGLIFGGALVLLVRLGILSSTVFTEQSFRLGLFWLMAFGSIALADRINLLQAEKAKADLEMRASEARYRGLVETMNDGLGVIDEENQITFVNSRLTEMLGYRPEEMLGRQITDFLDENNRQVMVRQLEERRTGIRSPYEVAWLRKDGRTLYSIVSPMPVFEDGRHYKGALGVVTDITERVLAGRNLEQRVDERTRELTTLLDVSHDITATQDLESILDLVLERLKTIVDYHGAVVFAEKDDCWNILGWHWPDPFSDPVLMEIAGSEIPALRREFEQRQSILIHQSSIDEQPQDGFCKIIRSLAKLDVPAPACWLGVPLLEKGVLFGILVLVHGHTGTFSEDQIKIAGAFANQISIAIENNRLYRQVRETAIAEERNRLARDLHDSVTQVLFSASLIAELLPQRLQRDPELALSSAAELRRLTHGALAEMRTMLLELRPEAITRGPLGELLTQLTEGMTSRVELAVDLYVENLPRLPADVQTAFYRIAQEALNNVIKHARANRVTISLSAAPPMGNQLAEDWKGEVKLIVQDDGIGYSPAVQPGEHLGLGIMRERAADIQAILTVERLPEYGTSVTLIWHR